MLVVHTYILIKILLLINQDLLQVMPASVSQLTWES